MDDRQAFLNTITAVPDDNVPRLVFADWLQEHGEDERAEFIRVQCALATNNVKDDEERAQFQERERELLEAHGQEWADEVLGAGHGLNVDQGMLAAMNRGVAVHGNGIAFERGFVVVHLDEPIEQLATIHAKGPVMRLKVDRVDSLDAMERLAQSDLLAHSYGLDLRGATRLSRASEMEMRAYHEGDFHQALGQGRIDNLHSLRMDRVWNGVQVSHLLSRRPALSLHQLELKGNLSEGYNFSSGEQLIRSLTGAKRHLKQCHTLVLPEDEGSDFPYDDSDVLRLRRAMPALRRLDMPGKELIVPAQQRLDELVAAAEKKEQAKARRRGKMDDPSGRIAQHEDDDLPSR